MRALSRRLLVCQHASGQDFLQKCLRVFKPHEVPIGLSAEELRGLGYQGPKYCPLRRWIAYSLSEQGMPGAL